MLTFALKKITVKYDLVSQSIVEDGKNTKNDYLEKNMPCNFFQVSYKKNLVSRTSLHQKNRPKNMHLLMQRFYFTKIFGIKHEKIYKAFPDFNYNFHQYSLFYSFFLYGV